MALIAHWPLTGNIDDYSGYNNTLINSGGVSNSSGKIGECYYLAGTGVSTSVL